MEWTESFTCFVLYSPRLICSWPSTAIPQSQICAMLRSACLCKNAVRPIKASAGIRSVSSRNRNNRNHRSIYFVFQRATGEDPHQVTILVAVDELLIDGLHG